MRHAIADASGGAEKANAQQFSQTYYALALRDFTGAQACDGSTLPRQKLAELFPNWKFDYWVTKADQKADPTKALDKCPTEFEPDPTSSGPQPPAPGSGVAVSLADFYVLAPSPLILSSGVFEQSDSLRLALAYRDRLSQEIIDRNIVGTVKDLSGNSKAMADSIAFELLNEGWGWQTRQKSMNSASASAVGP
jgi:hypothetical protein